MVESNFYIFAEEISTWFTVYEVQRVQSHHPLLRHTGSVEQGHLKGLIHLTDHSFKNLPLRPGFNSEAKNNMKNLT